MGFWNISNFQIKKYVYNYFTTWSISFIMVLQIAQICASNTPNLQLLNLLPPKHKLITSLYKFFETILHYSQTSFSLAFQTLYVRCPHSNMYSSIHSILCQTYCLLQNNLNILQANFSDAHTHFQVIINILTCFVKNIWAKHVPLQGLAIPIVHMWL